MRTLEKCNVHSAMVLARVMAVHSATMVRVLMACHSQVAHTSKKFQGCEDRHWHVDMPASVVEDKDMFRVIVESALCVKGQVTRP